MVVIKGEVGLKPCFTARQSKKVESLMKTRGSLASCCCDTDDEKAHPRSLVCMYVTGLGTLGELRFQLSHRLASVLIQPLGCYHATNGSSLE